MASNMQNTPDSTSSDLKETAHAARSRHTGRSLGVVLLLIVILAAAYFVLSRPSGTAQNPNYTTTVPIANSVANLSVWNATRTGLLDLSMINGAFGQSAAKNYYSAINFTPHTPAQSLAQCEGVLAVRQRFLIPNGNLTFSNTSAAANVNPKLPLLAYASSSAFVTPPTNLAATLSSCYALQAFNNVSYSQYLSQKNETAQIGTNAVLFTLRNYTSLNLARDSQMLGTGAPPVTYYLVGMSYKNVVIVVVTISESKYANESMAVGLTRIVFSQFLNRYNAHH